MKHFFTISLLIIIIQSCATPKLTNIDRGNYTVQKLNKVEDILNVNVKIIPLPKPKSPEKEKPKYFFDLNDSTETKYLEIIHSMVNSDADKFIEYLKKPIYEPTKSEVPLETDFSLFKARFYLSNVKRYYRAALNGNDNFIHPNTRLSWLTTTLELSEKAPIELVTIDKLQNEYEIINLGSIERNQSATFNGKISSQYGINSENTSGNNQSSALSPISANTIVKNTYDENGNLIDSTTSTNSDSTTNSRNRNNSRKNGVNAGVGGEVGFANTEAIREAFNMAYNEFKTGFSFGSDHITISQKGRLFSDISNNVIISATLKPKSPAYCRVHNFKNLFTKDVPNPANEIILIDRAVKYIPCDFENSYYKTNIDVNYDGLFRTVRNSEKSISRLEYDDIVDYFIFESDNSNPENKTDITIDLSEYCKKIYRLWARFDDGSEHILQIDNPNTLDAHFLEDENPLALYKWILEVTKNPSQKLLQTNKFTMFFVGPTGEITHLVNSEMKVEDFKELNKIKELYFEEVLD